MIRVDIMTFEEIGVVDLILDYIPRVKDVLWFHEDPNLSKHLQNKFGTTSFIVEKVCHWLYKPDGTQEAIHSIALYVTPEIIK